MKRVITAALLGAALSMPAVLPATAASNPSGTGQPSQSCLSSTAPTEPGSAAASPGSAFNEVNGTANGIYANPDTQGGTSSGNAADHDSFGSPVGDALIAFFLPPTGYTGPNVVNAQ